MLVIILLVPIVVFSQPGKSKKTLTPYADIEFQDGFVVYSAAWNITLSYPRLKPTVINMKLMRLKYDYSISNVNGTYIKKSQKSIRDYINNEPVGQLAKKDKLDYLKLCALLVIWDNDLSKHAVAELEKLSASSDKEIKENAELVIKLFEFYQQNNRRK